MRILGCETFVNIESLDHEKIFGKREEIKIVFRELVETDFL